MKKLFNKDILFLGFLSLLYLKLKTYLAYNGAFDFTYDQGRDLLEASKIVFEKNITLIGPTTGLPGIFYGPWWYYILSIPVLISGGNPTFVAIVFTFIGLATSIALYLFLRYITGSFILSAFFSYLSLVSSFWMLSPTFIWSPTLVPVFMTLLFFSFYNILKTKSTPYYFLYGLSSQIILQGEVAFGVMITLWTFLSILIYRKYLFTKNLVWTLIGIIILWIPQILFEIRNNFLETKAAVSYLHSPKIYGEEAVIYIRFLQRLDSYFNLFSQTFLYANNLLSFLLLSFFILTLIVVYKKPTFEKNIKTLVDYLLSLIIFSIIFFTFFKDRIWDYYLIGLPTTFVILAAIILKQSLKTYYLKVTSIIFIIIVLLLNLPNGLFSRFNETKITGGGMYINAQRVVNYIESQKPKNYSIYVYSPAIFDPPFDYLLYWYNRKGLIEKPKENQQIFYLIIREYSSKKYFNEGWYVDKTRDKSTLLEEKAFSGDIVLEKHTF